MFTPSSPERRATWALALLRSVVGLVFAAHGAQKLFVYGLDGVTAAFTQMGVPLPGIVGPFVAALELLGGVALTVGLFSRLAALGLAADMVGAMLLVHLPQGFFLPGGVEFTLVLFAGASAVAVGGPGAYALEGRLRRPSVFTLDRLAGAISR